jgi:predicted dienelactone hydrolase
MKFTSACVLLASATAAHPGSYTPARKFYDVENFDGSKSSQIDVYYPSDAKKGEKFPLISYAHGAGGGGRIDILGYTRLFNDIASYGFIIAAPNACNMGCSDTVAHPYADCNPTAQATSGGWSTWFGMQLKAIEWAQNQSAVADPILSMLDNDAGVGIAGHSMGGQSTTWAAHDDCAARWNIKAAVNHHGAGGKVKSGQAAVNITKTPFAAYTSSGDGCCETPTVVDYDNAKVKPKVLRDIKGSSHLEPVLEPPAYNTNLGIYTAAFFKIYLNGDQGEFYDMIYNENSESHICKSQDMARCEVVHADSSVQV